MRGTNCTPEQIESARKFLQARSRCPTEMPEDSRPVVLPFGDLARIVAWYGALRYVAGRDGTGGTLESPGPIDGVRSGDEKGEVNGG